MHNHLVLFLSCRVLKVFRQLIEHDVPVDRVCLDTFRQLEARYDDLGDAFSLLKNRIQDIGTLLVVNDEPPADKQGDAEEDKEMKQDEGKE